MDNQNRRYLKIKGSTYYFTRRVPKTLQKYCNIRRVELCLHTASVSCAQRQAAQLSYELEDHWALLRRKQRGDQFARLFHTSEEGLYSNQGISPSVPLMTEALNIYLRLKGGANRPDTFESGAKRSVSYLLEAVIDKPIIAYTRQDANAFKFYLQNRGLSRDSVSRNLANIRAIINFVASELGVNRVDCFNKMYLGEKVATQKRYVPTQCEIKRISVLCRARDDQLRWLLGIIIDTGMRLSEVTGLVTSDIFLDGDIPYLHITQHPWRRLKTLSSERKVPLVGCSLWAATRARQATDTRFLFPTYANNQRVNSNSASAALNKWLKSSVDTKLVVHSLRHAMRDRLRNAECPPDVIDTIGGWTRNNVGEKYGRGHSIETLHKWMVRAFS